MSVMTIKLSRSEGTPWGFRLQGGKDFATPLCIQKVNGGSVAAVAGLQAGDAIVSIGGKDALSLRHKEAQEAILRAGNTFDLVVQRGAPTWKPQVTPLAQVKTTPEGVPVATKTSLAANKKPVAPIGARHNTVATPFAEVNGQQIVNAQYNSPLNLYSEDNIAETLSAQAEVLGKGCLGINFQKYARETVIQTESPTYKLIHGDQNESKKARPPPRPFFDKEPEPVPEFPRPKPAAAKPPQPAAQQPAAQQSDGPVTASGPGPGPAGTRSVRAPEAKVNPPVAPSQAQLNKCSECERPLT